jgi:hypothetical protein
MASPLNGLGTGPQIPLANTFQPGQNINDQRTRENTGGGDVVKLRGTKTASSQNSEAGNQSATRAPQRENVKPLPAENSNAKRGSIVDITI